MERFVLKRVLIVFLFTLPMFSILLSTTIAFIPNHPELIASYSISSPIIDGYLNGTEWGDATGYKVNLTGPTEIETWLYFKHNSTHIYIGLVVLTYLSNTLDQFAIMFDEGDDGSYGSGSRDYNLVSNQEDIKKCLDDNTITDGYYKDVSFYIPAGEVDFVAECVHENDHFTAEWEIEYWEGLGWVDDHWECEFAIPFVGNDGGAVDLSDLNCTMMDTVGIKIQYFTQPGANNYFYPAENQYQIFTYANLSFSPPPFPAIESCNITGAKKDNFDPGETVYVNGSNYSPSTIYDFYIVNDVTTWTNGLPIPARVPDTAITVSSDALGIIPPTAVWADPQTLGEYDLIVDVNGNGLYDVDIDALDDNDIEVTAGFIIPEFSSILLLFIVATAASVILLKKRKLLSRL